MHAASIDIARRRAEEERAEAFFPSRATTTSADQSAMCERRAQQIARFPMLAARG
jgi:hypothetical protein